MALPSTARTVDRFATLPQADQQVLQRAWRFKTDTGSTVDYWAEEVAVTPASSFGLSVSQGGVDISTANATTVALAPNSSFVGQAEDITKYPHVTFTIFATPSSAKASAFFEFSPDGANWDISVPILVENPTLFIPYPLINVGKFFRVRYVNDGGAAAVAVFGGSSGAPTAQTAMRLNTLLHKQPTKELTRTLAQTITAHQPAILTRSVPIGQQPDGSFANVPVSGSVPTNSSTSAIGANGNFTGQWFDATGWEGLMVLVNSDQPSAAAGLTIEFSESSAGAFVHRTESFQYDSTGVGVARFVPSMQGEYFRISYFNGTTASTNTVIRTELLQSQAQVPLGTIGAPMSSVSLAQMVRAIPAAPNDGGVFGNITRGSSGGLRVSMNEAETEMPIKALDSWHSTQASITTASGGQLVATPGLTRRKSVSLKADPGNSRTIYVGYSTAVSPSNSYPLGAGDAIDLELSTSISIYAISQTSPQTLAWAEVASST